MSRMTEHIGRVLGGRYRLLAPIGRGASAQVFVADDVRLRRQVAVKVLHAGLAEDQAFLRRFRIEAQAAAALNHPHVMAVYDWGHDDDETPWIVTEYLGGGSLRGLLDRGHRLTPSQALVVGLQTARGLEYAHRRGFVHRDIKPANLLFDDDSRLRIADFGLARALAEAAGTEPQGAVVGTARYASPEQAQGLALSGRADVYSLALVLVEAVTGEVPFATDTTLGTLMARIGRALVVPEALGPLAEVLRAAGGPDPDDRSDARTLAVALARVAPALPRPAPLALAGASEVDLVDDRHLTELVGGPSADDLEVPDWVGHGSAGGAVDISSVDDDRAEEPDRGPRHGDDPVPAEPNGDPTVLERGPGDDDPREACADKRLDGTEVRTARPASPFNPRGGDVTRAMAQGATGGHDADHEVDDEDEDLGDWDPRSPTGRRRRRWPAAVFVILLLAGVGAALGLLVADLARSTG